MNGASGGSDGFAPAPPVFVWPRRRKFQDRRWVHGALFVATVCTTMFAGVDHYLAFLSDFGTRDPHLKLLPALLAGIWYSGTILAILGCHELGHYFACRYYDVDASLPFFLPVPPPLMTGTLGAFIRIREPIGSKRMLFDIGIAGPIAGFLVAVPALFFGLAMSDVAKVPATMHGFELGEPLLFQLASRLLWGTPPDGYSINLHPMAFAAWFGLLATALNLFPIGQLDGGHISYAVLGRRSTYVTLVMIAVALALTYLSTSWMVWTGLMVAMLFAFGPRHPSTPDEQVPLDGGRVVLAIVAVAMFALCFTPAPIEPLNLIRR
jgi:membrane-associated protease RseP (regulator of RpoE activity)